jgi:hypothetical protein
MFRSRRQVKLDMLLRPYIKKVSPRMLKYFAKVSQEPAPLSFPLHPRQPEYGLQPLGPLGPLPFRVTRTNSGNLPVYYKYNDGYRNPQTILRRIEGDVAPLAE